MATATEPMTAIVSAVIPLTMRTQLEQLAHDADRSLSSEIRRALRGYLKTHGHEEPASA